MISAKKITGFTQEEIIEQKEKVCLSKELSSKSILCRLLDYLVDKTLAGREETLKGYTIGIELFNKDQDFDGEQDPIVRIHAGRLRRALNLYYLQSGNDDQGYDKRGRVSIQTTVSVVRAGAHEKQHGNGKQGISPGCQPRFRCCPCRCRQRFAASIVILHSGLGEAERYRAWEAARDGSAHIVIGTRSAIFTPLRTPGLIIVDEEHDGSYKQQDGFRYSARDVAVKRGQLEACPVLLGSATPSLESLHNATAGRYQLHRLRQRAGSVSANDAQNNRLQPDLQFRGFTASPLLGLSQGVAVYQNGVRVNEVFGDTVNWDLMPSSSFETTFAERPVDRPRLQGETTTTKTATTTTAATTTTTTKTASGASW